MRTAHTVLSRAGLKPINYLIYFALTVVLALVLLILAAFLPQSAINQHVLDSEELIYRDVMNVRVADESTASTIDIGTDMLILRTSMATSSRYLGSVLSNPVYTYSDLTTWEGNAETVIRQAYELPHDGMFDYAKYWLGFRAFVRFALTFLNYAQLKRYLAFLFFTLLAAAMSSVAKHTDSKLAFLFGLSIILVRPHVMATSMQLTCCFLIAFVAMLCIPWLSRHPQYESLFFMEVGMVTMYMDFYTVPLVTLGLPLVYLCAMQASQGRRFSWKMLLKDSFVWFAGWGFMWIANLVLTTLLTSTNALESGITSFMGRTGITKRPHLMQYYSVSAAFDGIREAVFSDTTGGIIYLLISALVLLAVYLGLKRKRISLRVLYNGYPFLFLAIVPLLWFVLTKQPIAIHYSFQYRTIALTHWAAGTYIWYLLYAPKKQLPE